MKRRELVIRIGSLLLLLPASRLVSACGGTSGPTTGGGDGGTGNGTGGDADAGLQDLTFTSSAADGHTHTVTLEATMLNDSPASGAQKTTSVADGHTHTVSLTEAELDAIAAGQTVQKETTPASGHTHTYEFRRS